MWLENLAQQGDEKIFTLLLGCYLLYLLNIPRNDGRCNLSVDDVCLALHSTSVWCCYESILIPLLPPQLLKYHSLRWKPLKK